jgi:mannosylglycerate hydrolase
LPVFRSCGSNTEDERASIPGNRFSSERQGTGAQLIGTQRAHYSLFPHKGNWQQAKVYKVAQEAATRLWPEMLHINEYSKWYIGPYGFDSSIKHSEPSLPSELSFLDVKTDGIMLSAFKKAENGEAIIARFYNTTDEAKTAEIDFFDKAEKVVAVNLLEENANGLPKVDWELTEDARTQVKIPFRPFQIVTLRFKNDAPEEKRWHHTIY